MHDSQHPFPFFLPGFGLRIDPLVHFFFLFLLRIAGSERLDGVALGHSTPSNSLMHGQDPVKIIATQASCQDRVYSGYTRTIKSQARVDTRSDVNCRDAISTGQFWSKTEQPTDVMTRIY